jgi:hypothetical protein
MNLSPYFSAFSAFSARTHFGNGVRPDILYFRAENAENAEKEEGA